MQSKGKKFEEQFFKDWLNSFPNSFIYRLADQQSHYGGGGSRNPCDFICYTNNKLFLIECKSHAGNTLPFSNLKQLDLLHKYSKIDSVNCGFVIWMYDHDSVFYIPCKEIIKMKLDGLKSFNVNNYDGYNVYVVPSEKKRIFMNSDYKFITEV